MKINKAHRLQLFSAKYTDNEITKKADTGHKEFEKRTDVITETISSIIEDLLPIPLKIMEIIEHLVNFALQPTSNIMSPYHHSPPDEFRSL